MKNHYDYPWLRVFAVFLFVLASAHAQAGAAGAYQPRVTLPGHVLPALSDKRLQSTREARKSDEALTLTATLRRSDEAGFDRYVRDVYDAASPQFRRYLSQRDLTDQFGPTAEAYERVLAYLTGFGFQLVNASENRLTLTVRGSRAQAEQAFDVTIGDYRIGERSFHANDLDPSLPIPLARDVLSITGLTNAAVPSSPLKKTKPNDVRNACINDAIGLIPLVSLFQAYMHQAPGQPPQDVFGNYQDLTSVVGSISALFGNLFGWLYFQLPTAVGHCAGFYLGYLSNHPNNFFLRSAQRPLGSEVNASNTSAAPKAVAKLNTQKIGLLEFDTFHVGDIQDWLALIHADPTLATRLSQVHVNGGAASPGPGESEVLLDIASAMLASKSANTRYVVYDAPSNTSFLQILNFMINDGVTVISNSWSECEDQHTLADVQSLDVVLAQAAASGISVVTGSGDTGSTCLDGSPNTVGVPASSARATAVGGTSPTFGPAFMYGSEAWWNGAADVPPTGQGGFGVSRFFARPAYQNGLTASATRSVPDVAMAADPRAGLTLCQADAGGCPTGSLYGGTSMAAPLFAGTVAYFNETIGTNLGELNPAIYTFAGTNAFHTAASMGSDFSHVGLGSPNFDNLLARLSHYQIGPVSAATSAAGGTLLPIADGTTAAFLRVNLTDANHYHVAGKTVNVTPNAGSHAVVTSSTGASDDVDGAVVFTVTDTVAETVTFTVVDVTDGITLAARPSLKFVSPPATSGGIVASPSTIAANGTSTTTITITLRDANGNGATGKTVTISQGGGHSVIAGPTPPITDSNGQIQFTATDTVSESVSYTAVDVTDGNLPVPGSAPVNFTGGNISCLPAPPTAAAGYTLTPFANGFIAQNFFFGNINFLGCPGASNPAFDSIGNVFVTDFPTGDLYKFGSGGGAVSSANKLSNLGKTFGNLVIGKDGNLYGTTFSPSAVVQVNPTTGAVVRTLASGFTCPAGLAVDPLSGDLFFDDACTGGGSDSPQITRIQNTASATPTPVAYANLPGTPGGQLAFSPDGTLYAVSNAFNNANAPIVRFTGTNAPAPHNPVVIQGITADTGGVAIGEVFPNGTAKSLIVHSGGAANGAGGSLKLIDVSTLAATVLANGIVEPGVIGPDGCMYVNAHDTILRLAPSAGGCAFSPTNPSPGLTLTASSLTAAQGSSTTLTARFINLNVPAGAPVTFQLNGANSQARLANTDASGTATVTVLGKFTGGDTVTAVATVGSTTYASAPLQLTWSSGKHATFLTLNLSLQAGTTGQQVTLTGTLTDVSNNAAAPIGAMSVVLAVGAQSCSGVTDGQGNARCSVVVPSRPAGGPPLLLSANFAGNAQYTASSDSEPFLIVAAVGPTAPGAPTIGTATAGPGQAIVTFTPPTSDGGSPITSYSVTCTGGGTSVSASGPASAVVVPGLTGGVTYTCTVTATNASGTSAPSASSNAVLILAVVGPQLPVNIPTLGEWMLLLLAASLLVLGAGALRVRRP